MLRPRRAPRAPLLVALAALVLYLLDLAVLASLRASPPPEVGHGIHIPQAAIDQVFIIPIIVLLATGAGIAAVRQASVEGRRAWTVCLSVLLVLGPGVLLFWIVYQSGHTLRGSEIDAYQILSIIGHGLLIAGVLMFYAVGRRSPPIWPAEPPM